MGMSQPKTDYGQRHESGESEPKGVKSRDSSGEKHEGTKNGVGMGEKDGAGVQHGVGRSGMGQHDGRMGEFNSGRKESEVYTHKRVKHAQD